MKNNPKKKFKEIKKTIIHKDIKKLEEPIIFKKELEEDNEKPEDEEIERPEEELEDIVSRTPSSRISLQRHTINPFLEIEESQQEPRLEEQIQNVPANTISQTITPADNVQRYVANAPSYSASTDYNPDRGDYDGAGYPKQMQIQDPFLNQQAPFLNQQAPFDTFQKQQIVKPWIDQMQNPSQSTMQPEERKYESIEEPKKRKIW